MMRIRRLTSLSFIKKLPLYDKLVKSVPYYEEIQKMMSDLPKTFPCPAQMFMIWDVL